MGIQNFAGIRYIRPIYIYSRILFRILTLGSRRFTAMAIWPFIISRLDKNELGNSVVNHEKIHFRQQLEMLIIPFYLWYGIEYGIHLMRLRDKQQAYLAISLEKEAYQHEQEIDYLKKRKLFAWTRYL